MCSINMNTFCRSYVYKVGVRNGLNICLTDMLCICAGDRAILFTRRQGTRPFCRLYAYLMLLNNCYVLQ